MESWGLGSLSHTLGTGDGCDKHWILRASGDWRGQLGAVATACIGWEANGPVGPGSVGIASGGHSPEGGLELQALEPFLPLPVNGGWVLPLTARSAEQCVACILIWF